MRIPSFFKSFCSFGLTLMMLTLSVVESFGQDKVYASSYGWEESGGGLLGTTYGRVDNPENATSNTNKTDHTRLRILTVLGLGGPPSAKYQFKFQDNLPGGTPVYIRVSNTGTTGLLNLGLLLASDKSVSVQSGADLNNTQISGSSLSTSQFTSSVIQINGEEFARVIPSQDFNAITITLDNAGLELLGILIASGGSINLYYAYYECPAITVSQQEPACAGHPFTLSVDNPINTNYTWYPANSTANPLGTGNTITLTEASAASKNYYLKHNQFSATCGLDTVTVDIGAIPDNPTVSLE